MRATPSSSAASTTANVSSRVEVAGGEDQAVACDRAQHVSRLGQKAPVGIGDVHRVDAEAEAAKLVLEPRPLGHLVPVPRLGPPGRLRGRVDGRHPDDPCALARGDLDREGVHAADRPVEGERADDLAPPGRGRHDLRALGGRRVVGLEGEAREPELGEALREREVVDPPPRHVRSDVDVQVVGTLDEHARPLARRRRDGCCVVTVAPRVRRARARRAAPRSPTRCAARHRARAAARAPPPSRRRVAPRAAGFPRASRSSSGWPITAAISSSSQSAWPAASAARCSRARRRRAPS